MEPEAVHLFLIFYFWCTKLYLLFPGCHFGGTKPGKTGNYNPEQKKKPFKLYNPEAFSLVSPMVRKSDQVCGGFEAFV
jgi:hypothetical protein